MAILATYDSRADWLLWYRVVVDGIEYTYGDAPQHFWREAVIDRADELENLGILPIQRILIVGSGMGYLIEELHDRGYPNVWGLESSSYIDSKRGDIAGDVLFVSGNLTGGVQIRNALRDLTGDRVFDWIISEDVLTCYPEPDIPTLLNAAESILASAQPLSHIVHFVTPGPFKKPEIQGKINDKTMAQWTTVRSTHTWRAE